MLEIKPQLVENDQYDQILRLQKALGVPQGDYPNVNTGAQRDHRVELPIMHMAKVVQQLADAKNKVYDNSYSKRGLFSIFFNMERKWERVVSQVFNGNSLRDAMSETFLDTCVDLAAYATKLCGWICARRPDLYLRLLQATAKECRDAGIIPDEEFEPDTAAVQLGDGKGVCYGGESCVCLPGGGHNAKKAVPPRMPAARNSQSC